MGPASILTAAEARKHAESIICKTTVKKFLEFVSKKINTSIEEGHMYASVYDGIEDFALGYPGIEEHKMISAKLKGLGYTITDEEDPIVGVPKVFRIKW